MKDPTKMSIEELKAERLISNSMLIASLRNDEFANDLDAYCTDDSEFGFMTAPIPVDELDLSEITLSGDSLSGNSEQKVG